MNKNFLFNSQLQPADVIVAKKRHGLGRILNHYIVYLGNNSYMGNLSGGVKTLNNQELLSLLNDYEPIKIRSFTGSNYQRQLAINRAYSKLGHRYSLLKFNCEHFANWVQRGKESSTQVKVAVTLLLLGITCKLIQNRR